MTKGEKSIEANTQRTIWPANIIDASDGSGDAILILPDDLCDQLGWKIGDTFDLSLGKNKEIIIKKID
jgi:hypothetical protein